MPHIRKAAQKSTNQTACVYLQKPHNVLNPEYAQNAQFHNVTLESRRVPRRACLCGLKQSRCPPRHPPSTQRSPHHAPKGTNHPHQQLFTTLPPLRLPLIPLHILNQPIHPLLKMLKRLILMCGLQKPRKEDIILRNHNCLKRLNPSCIMHQPCHAINVLHKVRLHSSAFFVPLRQTLFL